MVSKNWIFFNGGVRSHSKSPTSSYGSNREFLPVDPWSTQDDLPRKLRVSGGSGVERQAPKSPHKNAHISSMYWRMARKKHISFFFLLVSYVNGIFSLWLMIEEKIKKWWLHQNSIMVVLISLVKPYWTVWGLRFFDFCKILWTSRNQFRHMGPQNTPKMIIFSRKPMVVGYHHFRKPHIWISFPQKKRDGDGRNPAPPGDV